MSAAAAMGTLSMRARARDSAANWVMTVASLKRGGGVGRLLGWARLHEPLEQSLARPMRPLAMCSPARAYVSAGCARGSATAFCTSCRRGETDRLGRPINCTAPFATSRGDKAVLRGRCRGSAEVWQRRVCSWLARLACITTTSTYK